MIDRRVGRYHILEKLGEGGLATVWKARDELLNRIVALKILDEKWAQSDETVRRFLHEGRSTAALSHPGIVGVHDSGMADGVPYLVLECVDGEVLAERIRSSLLPIPEAVRIVRSVADALAHAHEQRVIHRDVTARNVMLARDRRVVVLDFGLALAAWESRLTVTGTRMGTVPYIAPEILRGLDADARSDQYSLGILFYEALTGATPFQTDNPAALIHRALHEAPVPPADRRPDLPAALNDIVLRAIARERDERFPNLRDFIAALDGARLEGPRTAPPALEPPRADPGSRPLRPDPLYLAIAPFGSPPNPGEGGERSALEQRLAFTLRAMLSAAGGVRLVDLGESAGSDLRAASRTCGANALLEGSVAQHGSQLRVSYALIDVQRGVQFAGGVVDGSASSVFDLEDEVARSVRASLSLSAPPAWEPRGTRLPDPAREEVYLQSLASLKRYDSIAMVDGAIRLLEDLTAAEPDSARLLATLGRAYLYKYRITKQRPWEARAANIIEQAVEFDPEGIEVHLALGDLQIETGAHAVALAEYRRVLESDRSRFDALLGMARAHLAMGRTAAAESDAIAAIDCEPEDWRGHSLLGEVLYHEGKLPAALGAFQRVVALTPDNAIGHRKLGTCYYGLDRFDEAVIAYRRSLAIQPNAFGYSNLGTVLFFLGSHEEAAEAFKKATLIRPADPFVWGNLGNACRWIAGRDGESIDALDRAIALAYEKLERNASDFELWARTAEWLASRGRKEEARKALTHAIAIAPDDMDVIVRAAHVHVDLGELAEAIPRIRQAVERGYPVTEFRRSIALTPLHGDPEFERILEHGSASAEHMSESNHIKGAAVDKPEPKVVTIKITKPNANPKGDADPHKASANKNNKTTKIPDVVEWTNHTGKTASLKFEDWPFASPERVITVPDKGTSERFPVSLDAALGNHEYGVTFSNADAGDPGDPGPPGDPGVLIGD
jgi:tetratricopeptide (TPR) repeat protein